MYKYASNGIYFKFLILSVTSPVCSAQQIKQIYQERCNRAFLCLSMYWYLYVTRVTTQALCAREVHS